MSRGTTRNTFIGYTFIELMVVLVILSLVLGLVYGQYRSSRSSMGSVAARLSSHMEMRRAVERLAEALFDGTEIVTPPPGSTRVSLVVKDIANFLKVFYLEKQVVNDPKFLGKEMYKLYSYTDTFTGKFEPAQSCLLFGNIKELTFTAVAPGLVVVHLTMIDSSGKDLGAIVEFPLKNLGSVDG